MSFIDCIKKGKLSTRSQKEAIDLYNDRFTEQKRGGLSDVDADAIAAKETADILEFQKAAEKKRQIKMVQVQRTISKNLDTYRNAKGEVDYAEAAINMIEAPRDSKFATVEGRRQAILSQVHGHIAGFLEKYEAKYSGLVLPKTGLRDVARAMFGDADVNQSAKELAESLTAGLEVLRVRANRAGANIAKKENFGLPQTHDRVRVAKTSMNDWVDFVIDKLDWDKMVDPNTGKAIPPLKRQAVLEGVYNSIKTDGYSKLRPNEMQRVGALDKRMANHRFLEFKSGNDWMDYHESFGVGSVFDVVVNHTNKMSRDIAMMEILGPNPYHGKEFLKQAALQRAAKLDAQNIGATTRNTNTDKTNRQLKKLDGLYSMYMNTDSAGGESMFANAMAGTRNILTSSFLGAASILALVGDTMTTALTKRFNGLQGTRDITTFAKLLNPLDASDRKLAARSGMINDTAISLAFGQERFTGEIMGPQWTRRVADVVLRASFLTPITQAKRWAFGMEVFGLFADNAHKSFDDVPFKKMLDNYGITPEEWNIFRSTKKYGERGVELLRPDDLRVREDLDAQFSQDLADKISEMIYSEMNFAVPTGTIRGRHALIGNTREGTIAGEILRSGAMFKNFPVTIMFTHIARGLNEKTLSSKAKYLSAFFIGMTSMGALSTQMKQISQGKDVMDMNPENENGRKFWAQAALAGGGMGIMGDFLFQNVNRYGSGLGTTIAGPVAALGTDITNLTVGNVLQAAQGEDTNIAGESVRFATKYAPGKSLWYLRLAVQREIFDQLLIQADPKAKRKMASQARRMKRDRGQEYFWPAGKSVLQGDKIRGPDFEAAFQE